MGERGRCEKSKCLEKTARLRSGAHPAVEAAPTSYERLLKHHAEETGRVEDTARKTVTDERRAHSRCQAHNPYETRDMCERRMTWAKVDRATLQEHGTSVEVKQRRASNSGLGHAANQEGARRHLWERHFGGGKPGCCASET